MLALMFFAFKALLTKPWLTKTSLCHYWDDLEAARPSDVFVMCPKQVSALFGILVSGHTL